MKQLSLAARVYVSTVILAGAVILCVRVPGVSFPEPALFVALLVLSCASAAMKITLPLSTGASTMSVSYAIDFTTLLLLGTVPTFIVAAASAFCQCVLKSRERPPLHRILFSVAALVVTVAGAGLTFESLTLDGGDPITAVARPLLGAATIYFLLNSALVATAVACLHASESCRRGMRTFSGARRATLSVPAQPPSRRGLCATWDCGSLR